MTRKPQSLAELQSLGHGEFEEVEDYQYHGSPAIERILRHTIELSARELAWQGHENANSLRDFWYSPVKPILERAFPEKAGDPEYKFSRRMSQNLSSVLSDMVKDGEVTYRDLNILDDSRSRNVAYGSPEDTKVLFVEKEAVYRKLQPLAGVYEMTVVSGSGWQATAAIEDLVHELDGGETYEFYVLSDFDPTGFRIVSDFESRSNTLGIDVDSVTRVAINPDQVDDHTMQTQKFSPAVENGYDERWMLEHAIDGQYGLEIEAIGDLNNKGPALRRIAADALKPHISERERYERDFNVGTANTVRSAASGLLDDITEDLEAALLDAATDDMRPRDGVRSVSWERNDNGNVVVSAGADYDTGVDGRSHLPEPRRDDDLHDGAVDGEYDAYYNGDAIDNLEDRLRERVNDGDINIEEYIDL